MTAKLPAIKGILLDFDGVLADSEKHFYRAAYDAFAEIGHFIDEDEYYKHWAGEGLGVENELQRHLIALSDEQIHDMKRKIRSRYWDRAFSGAVRLYPAARRFLEDLKSLASDNDIGLVIASNTTSDLIREVFIRNGYEDFGVPLTGKIAGLRKKPESDIFSYACGYLRIRPHEALVIEDMPKGIHAAKKIGIRVFALRTRYNRLLDLNESNRVFESHEELLAFLRKNICSACHAPLPCPDLDEKTVLKKNSKELEE